MIKNIIRRLTLGTLSMLLVVSFLFVDVKFNLPAFNKNSPGEIEKVLDLNHKDDFYGGFIRINPKEEMFEDVEASLILTVIGYVAMSVFLSLGAHYASEFIVDNASLFTDWYVDWYNDSTLQGGMSAEELARWNKAHEIPDYLEHTNQLNLDGSLKNDTLVLPDEYLLNVYDSARFYINDYQDAGAIDYQKYTFGDGVTEWVEYYPIYDGLQLLNVSNTLVTLKDVTPTSYVLNSNKSNYEITEVQIAPNVNRLKIVFEYNVITHAKLTRYSRDLTDIELNEIRQANGSFFSIDTSNGWLYPLYWQGDLAMTLEKRIKFDRSTTTSTTSVTPFLGNITNTDFILVSNKLITSMSDDLVYEDGYPINWGDEGNYYVVPIVSDPQIPTVPVTPVVPLPIEDEPGYEYTPPTVNPGLPDTPEWVDIESPASTVPFPSVSDLVDGTFVHNLGLWWGNVFTYSINTMMGWWSNFVGSLKMMLQMILDSLNNLSWPTDWFTNFFTNLTDWAIALFIPVDLDLKFQELMDYFDLKFGLLIYPLEIVLDVFNRFATLQAKDQIVFNGYTDPVNGIRLMPPFVFDFSDFADENNFEFLYILLQVIMNAIMVMAFAFGWFKSYEKVRDS